MSFSASRPYLDIVFFSMSGINRILAQLKSSNKLERENAIKGLVDGLVKSSFTRIESEDLWIALFKCKANVGLLQYKSVENETKLVEIFVEVEDKVSLFARLIENVVKEFDGLAKYSKFMISLIEKLVKEFIEDDSDGRLNTLLKGVIEKCKSKCPEFLEVLIVGHSAAISNFHANVQIKLSEPFIALFKITKSNLIADLVYSNFILKAIGTDKSASAKWVNDMLNSG